MWQKSTTEENPGWINFFNKAEYSDFLQDIKHIKSKLHVNYGSSKSKHTETYSSEMNHHAEPQIFYRDSSLNRHNSIEEVVHPKRSSRNRRRYFIFWIIFLSLLILSTAAIAAIITNVVPNKQSAHNTGNSFPKSHMTYSTLDCISTETSITNNSSISSFVNHLVMSTLDAVNIDFTSIIMWNNVAPSAISKTNLIISALSILGNGIVITQNTMDSSPPFTYAASCNTFSDIRTDSITEAHQSEQISFSTETSEISKPDVTIPSNIDGHGATSTFNHGKVITPRSLSMTQSSAPHQIHSSSLFSALQLTEVVSEATTERGLASMSSSVSSSIQISSGQDFTTSEDQLEYSSFLPVLKGEQINDSLSPTLKPKSSITEQQQSHNSMMSTPELQIGPSFTQKLLQSVKISLPTSFDYHQTLKTNLATPDVHVRSTTSIPSSQETSRRLINTNPSVTLLSKTKKSVSDGMMTTPYVINAYSSIFSPSVSTQIAESLSLSPEVEKMDSSLICVQASITEQTYLPIISSSRQIGYSTINSSEKNIVITSTPTTYVAQNISSMTSKWIMLSLDKHSVGSSFGLLSKSVHKHLFSDRTTSIVSTTTFTLPKTQKDISSLDFHKLSEVKQASTDITTTPTSSVFSTMTTTSVAIAKSQSIPATSVAQEKSPSILTTSESQEESSSTSLKRKESSSPSVLQEEYSSPSMSTISGTKDESSSMTATSVIQEDSSLMLAASFIQEEYSSMPSTSLIQVKSLSISSLEGYSSVASESLAQRENSSMPRASETQEESSLMSSANLPQGEFSSISTTHVALEKSPLMLTTYVALEDFSRISTTWMESSSSTIQVESLSTSAAPVPEEDYSLLSSVSLTHDEYSSMPTVSVAQEEYSSISTASVDQEEFSSMPTATVAQDKSISMKKSSVDQEESSSTLAESVIQEEYSTMARESLAHEVSLSMSTTSDFQEESSSITTTSVTQDE